MSERLSRQERYDLVWSEPLRTLSARFGISDVALKKTCAKSLIPTPERAGPGRLRPRMRPRHYYASDYQRRVERKAEVEEQQRRHKLEEEKAEREPIKRLGQARITDFSPMQLPFNRRRPSGNIYRNSDRHREPRNAPRFASIHLSRWRAQQSYEEDSLGVKTSPNIIAKNLRSRCRCSFTATRCNGDHLREIPSAVQVL